MQFKDVPLRTRRVLSPYILYSACALLALNGTLLYKNVHLITPFWLLTGDIKYYNVIKVNDIWGRGGKS